MQIIHENFWNIPADAQVIPTNGAEDKTGRNVMSTGIALQASHQYPGLARAYGAMIRERGHRVHTFVRPGCPLLFMLPTKPRTGVVHNKADVVEWYVGKVAIGDTLPGWMFKSNLKLIQTSLNQLVARVDARPHLQRIVMTPLGYDDGGLDWQQDVLPLLWRALDDRFILANPDRKLPL